jgi:hypothetical protein
LIFRIKLGFILETSLFLYRAFIVKAYDNKLFMSINSKCP